MKIVISKDGIKRELNTPFAMCIDTQHFADLIRAMQSAQAGMAAAGTSYGWVRIDTGHPDPDSAPNTKPLQWTDTGLMSPASDNTAARGAT